MKKGFVLLMLSLAGLSSCVEYPEVYPNTYEGNFQALWEIIDTRYCYLDYKQINWDSIYGVYQVKLDTVNDDYALFNVLGDMLKELKDGHVNLYSDFNKSRYWNWFTDYPSNFSSSLIYSDRYLGDDYLIAGGFDYALIEGGTVGYVYYSSFVDYFSDTNVKYLFDYFRNCQGLIIDVRNNGGGALDYAETLASYFMDEKTLTGYMCHKTGDGHSAFSDPAAVYTPAHESLNWEKPVVVLTNRMSYSATNSFVCRMKEAPRAVIVGDQTGGGGGLPLSNELPNGWMVRFSACPMYDARMQQIEFGLEPDVAVALDSTDTANGFDTLIEQAVALIKQ